MFGIQEILDKEIKKISAPKEVFLCLIKPKFEQLGLALSKSQQDYLVKKIIFERDYKIDLNFEDDEVKKAGLNEEELKVKIQNIFDDLPMALDEFMKNFEDEITAKIHDIATKIEPLITTTLKKNLPKALSIKRSQSDAFTERNKRRWGKGFDLLEMLQMICVESGEVFNKSYRPSAVKNQDILFEALIRIHARACHVTSEILCLLKNGYSDGAHSRWRTLHELTVTAFFISKHGKLAAEHFLAHEIVENYKAMCQYNEHAKKLNLKPFKKKEIAQSKSQFDSIIKKYGNNFKTSYGWASVFLGNKRPNFSDIEKDTNFEHMRPYFKWASDNVHANIKGIRNKLGLCETNEDVLLVGQSNSGMTDPAHMTALSMTQITTCLLTLNPSMDSIVIMKVIDKIQDEIGQAFLKCEKQEEN